MTRSEHVFVYGILLRQTPYGPPGEPASLNDWRLAFDGGLATIEPEPGEYVAGALLSVDEHELRNFDGIEGVWHADPANGLYRRIRVIVDTPSDEHEAWVYVKNHRRAAGAPSPGMIATIHNGYRAWGLDVDKLEQALDRAREEEKAWT